MPVPKGESSKLSLHLWSGDIWTPWGTWIPCFVGCSGPLVLNQCSIPWLDGPCDTSWLLSLAQPPLIQALYQTHQETVESHCSHLLLGVPHIQLHSVDALLKSLLCLYAPFTRLCAGAGCAQGGRSHEFIFPSTEAVQFGHGDQG